MGMEENPHQKGEPHALLGAPEFSFFLFKIFIGVQLLYNVVLASTAQQNESALHIRISPPT